MDVKMERASLERIAGDSWYANGANAVTIRYSAKVFARHWRGRSCLELGPAEGLMTDTLAAAFPELTVVDGSERFCEDLRRRFPRAKVVQALFEEYEPEERFDNVVLGHVLEHVAAPRELLASVRTWLAPGGAVFAAVPNARSLHRQAAVIMGLLPTEHTLNDTDRHHGHRRVYDPESFRADFLAAGLKVEIFGGYWLKPLSNAQIDATWSPAMLDAFMALGERYPDVAAEIYVVASAH
jgi:2-polyprenyl-3-methyl-5-hydroxy-6-metoxy-1,4-benzoquinol methylase